MRKNFIVKFMTAILLFATLSTFVFVGDRVEAEAATNFEVVSDGSFDSLVAAIEKDNVDEIIVTATIMCNNSSRDYFLDGKNKIIRAAIIGVDESGMPQEGSAIDLIHVIDRISATIKNVTILGGSRLAIFNRGYLYLENVNIMRSGNYTKTATTSSYIYYGYGGIFNGDTGKLVMKNCNISRNVSKWGGAIYNYGGLVILDGCSLTENRANNRGGAIYSNGGKLVLNNTVIANNATVSVDSTAADIGGG